MGMCRSLLGVHFGTLCIHPVYFGALFFFTLFMEFYHLPIKKEKKKCICRLDLKIPAFDLKLSDLLNEKSSLCLLVVNCVCLSVLG